MEPAPHDILASDTAPSQWFSRLACVLDPGPHPG
jgi:hypothetical protein